MDRISKEKRSWNMSRIKSSNTKPERIVRSILHRNGFRFRLSTGRKLPGKPDIVLVKHRVAVFVHGCFWHRHANCKSAAKPKTETRFWVKKFAQNMQRDIKATKSLIELGWHVAVIWECESGNQAKVLLKIREAIPNAN